MYSNITISFYINMPKEESAIWKTGLFQRTEEGSNAVCLDCKEKGKKRASLRLIREVHLLQK